MLFIVAGVYNIGWGLYAAINPQGLFRFADMPPLKHPQIFACLGIVVGLYGLIYLEVARAPEKGWPLAAVGLLGKLLGPAGWAYLVLGETWPLTTVILILTNDVVWWAPFVLYLRDAWPTFRREIRGSTGH